MRSAIIMAGAFLILGGCEESGTGPAGEGTIVVVVTTSGGDPDLDGYEIRVDDRIGSPLAMIDEETYIVGAGQHRFEFTGVAPNCTVSGESVRTITLAAGGNERLEFRVICRSTGFRVSSTSFGVDLDNGGYQITIDGETKGTVAANSQMLISRMAPGTYTVGVTGVAPNCTLDGPPTRTLTVTNAELTPAAFAFTCVATSGVIRIEVVTTGPRPDNSLTVESSSSPGFEQPATSTPASGNSLRFLTPIVGVRYLRLMELAPHCTLAGDNPREVSVTVGTTVRDTAVARFEITCTAGDATLRMHLAATGSEAPDEFTIDVFRRINCDDYYGCSFELFEEIPIAADGPTSVPLPSDSYQVVLQVGSTCRSEVSHSSNIDLPTGGTADIQFEVFCERPLLRVRAPTTGSNPDTQYLVTLWTDYYWYGQYAEGLGTLVAGETMEVRVTPGGYAFFVELGGIATNCTVTTPNPSAPFTLTWGDVREVTFPVACGP